MSDREKKLVLIFGLAAFVLINVFGIARFRQYRDKAHQDMIAAQKGIETAQNLRDIYDERADEIDWMADHRPEPKARQTVETELEQFATKEAQAASLTIASNGGKGKFLESLETGYFHRARVEYTKVSGSEQALYHWLSRLRSPDDFRAVTFLRLKPDEKDDTQIDAQITVEQWFIPETGEAEDAAPSE